MAFPSLAAQQETNRKILEDLQLKRQLLQKAVNPVADINNLSNTSLPSPSIGQLPDFPQSSGASGVGGNTNTVPRSVFNPTSATTLGYFLPQDSHYGNSYIPVLPRLDPLPANHNQK